MNAFERRTRTVFEHLRVPWCMSIVADVIPQSDAFEIGYRNAVAMARAGHDRASMADGEGESADTGGAIRAGGARRSNSSGAAVRSRSGSVSALEFEVSGRRVQPFQSGVRLLVAAAVPTVVLYVVPQPTFASSGPIVVLLVVLAGAVAAGAAAALVLRSASRRPTTAGIHGAHLYFAASGLCFVTLCVVAPAAVLIGTFAWYDFRGLDARGIVMTAVASAGLLLGAVFAVGGAVLLRAPADVTRLAWAKVDLIVQVSALAAVLATIAILY